MLMKNSLCDSPTMLERWSKYGYCALRISFKKRKRSFLFTFLEEKLPFLERRKNSSKELIEQKNTKRCLCTDSLIEYKVGVNALLVKNQDC